MDEQRLERALRQGPPFATGYVPASIALDEAPVGRPRVGVARLALVIAVTTLLLATLLAALVAVGTQKPHLPLGPGANGWIAFVRGGDIFLVREGKPAHRIIGSDGDRLDQICPAFSPDGKRLAHGEANGTVDTGYREAALVISDIDAAGNASESRRIDIGGATAPPCAAWSADGRRVAFAVSSTSPGNDRSASAGQVWIASVTDGHVDVLSDLTASDLEWSPSGSLLAIANAEVDPATGLSIGDGSVRLHDADSGVTRTLVETGRSGVWKLTWSPDSSRIAYQQGASDGGAGDQEIRVVGADGNGEHRLTRSRFSSIYGVGPVWSPTGDRIVYQRMRGASENHDVVLLNPEDGSEVVLPELRLPRSDASWRPDSVTWSPDGKELLYSGWISGKPGRSLISRPLDLRSEPALIVEDLDAAAENRSWGRLPDAWPQS
jgi:dipeptidyl aminopeptidase/acylaminoacyl peptidase